MSLQTEGTHTALAREILQYIRSGEGLELTPNILEEYTTTSQEQITALESFKRKDWTYRYRCFKNAAKQLDMDKPEFKKLTEVSLKGLTKQHMNKFIELEQCNISTISPNRPIVLKMTYVCSGCGEEKSRPPKKGEDECCLVNNYEKRPNPDDVEDAQWLRIQELERSANQTKIPMAIPILMKGTDMLWKFGFNERIKPKGILRFKLIKTKMGDEELNPWFEVLDYDKTSGLDEEIELTPADKERIRAEMKKDGYWKKVVKSFCPWIYDQEVMKEVVLLGIGSMRTDMPLRILIIGDPSTGKSDVLKAGNMLPAQKHYTVMKNNRGTGLTVTSVKDPDTDQWTVEGGGFARAHKWCLIIDEFQAGKEEDIDGLNSVIWDHKIPYNLAGGVHGEFDASCALIIACNPQAGRMAKEENIFELLKFVGEKTLSAFISRMTFILYLEENNTKEFHEQVADHIYDNWSDEQKKRKFWEDWYEEVGGYDIEVIDGVAHKVPKTEERFGIKTLQKIVKYITEEVVITDPPTDLKRQFREYYVSKKMDVIERANKIVTARYMVHLLGIAQNIGRWHGRAAYNEDDMKYAFELMFHHMTLAATDPKTGEIDAGSVNGQIPESRMREKDLEIARGRGKGGQMDWACNKAGSLYDDRMFTIEELNSFLIQLGDKNKWSGEELMRWLENSIGSGSIKKFADRFLWTPLERRM
jgi:DNA replicative helicase MCM subunit Mcm2 (Cdc46/Mcm family)